MFKYKTTFTQQFHLMSIELIDIKGRTIQFLKQFQANLQENLKKINQISTVSIGIKED